MQAVREPVFTDDYHAYVYLKSIAKRDLEYRGFRDDRVACFLYKQEANFLLYQRVQRCTDEHELELLQQSWESTPPLSLSVSQ